MKCWNSKCASNLVACDCPPEKPHRCTVASITALAKANAAAASSNSVVTLAVVSQCGLWLSVQKGICVGDLKECAAKCLSPNVMCWDGSCMENEGQCPCRTEASHRCPDRTCATNATQCPCLKGMTRCSDGQCRVRCTSETVSPCPENKPFPCADGTCAEKPSLCPCSSIDETYPDVTLEANNAQVTEWLRVTAKGSYEPCGVDNSNQLSYCWSLTERLSDALLGQCCTARPVTAPPATVRAAQRGFHALGAAGDSKCDGNGAECPDPSECRSKCCLTTATCSASSCSTLGSSSEGGTCSGSCRDVAKCVLLQSSCERKCLGVVQCQTSECGGYVANTPCISDGSSDNFKVCPQATWCDEDHWLASAPAPPASLLPDCRTFSSCSGTQYEILAPTATSDRVCTELTVCASTEYETKAPTAKSDRVCTPLTVCSGSQYETRPPTATSDRLCSALTVCTAAQFEETAPTATSDRECRPVRQCTSSEFERVAPTAASDRICDPLTLCDYSYQYQSAAPTPKSDRVCSEITYCTAAEYEVRAPTETSNRVCKALTFCNESEYQTVAATETSDRVCKALTVCKKETEFEVLVPTTVSDRVCKALTVCTLTQYQYAAPTETADRVCVGLTTCKQTEFEVEAPTITTDRICAPLSECSAKQYEDAPPTATADRSCSALRVCATDEYETAAPTTTSDRRCSWLTMCTDTEYQKTAPTATTDRVCATLMQCTVGQYESKAPTPFSDRECQLITTQCPEGKVACAPAGDTTNVACADANAVCSDAFYIGLLPVCGKACCKAPNATLEQCSDVDACDLTYQYKSSTLSKGTKVVCVELTVCASYQYESTAPTPFSDRVCSNITTCLENEYEVSPPTAVTNRVCKAFTACAVNEFELTAPTAFSDRVCQDYTTCTAGTNFECAAPTEIADRVCCAVTNCVSGSEYETDAPTATTDRICAALTVCNEAEEFEKTAPTPTSDRVCQLQTFCTEEQYEKAPPTKTSDRVCETLSACPQGTYEDVTGIPLEGFRTRDRLCKPITVCSAAQYEVAAPTASNDRLCSNLTVCKSTEFEAAAPTLTSDRFCQAITQCSTAEYEKETFTATSDRVCALYTICTPSQFESVAPTTASDRACTDYTVCTEGMEYESTAPKYNSDRKCTILTICGSNEYEVQAPTATSDRVCKEKIIIVPTAPPTIPPTINLVCSGSTLGIPPNSLTAGTEYTIKVTATAPNDKTDTATTTIELSDADVVVDIQGGSFAISDRAPSLTLVSKVTGTLALPVWTCRKCPADDDSSPCVEPCPAPFGNSTPAALKLQFDRSGPALFPTGTFEFMAAIGKANDTTRIIVKQTAVGVVLPQVIIIGPKRCYYHRHCFFFASIDGKYAKILWYINGVAASADAVSLLRLEILNGTLIAGITHKVRVVVYASGSTVLAGEATLPFLVYTPPMITCDAGSTDGAAIVATRSRISLRVRGYDSDNGRYRFGYYTRTGQRIFLSNYFQSTSASEFVAPLVSMAATEVVKFVVEAKEPEDPDDQALTSNCTAVIVVASSSGVVIREQAAALDDAKNKKDLSLALRAAAASTVAAEVGDSRLRATTRAAVAAALRDITTDTSVRTALSGSARSSAVAVLRALPPRTNDTDEDVETTTAMAATLQAVLTPTSGEKLDTKADGQNVLDVITNLGNSTQVPATVVALSKAVATGVEPGETMRIRTASHVVAATKFSASNLESANVATESGGSVKLPNIRLSSAVTARNMVSVAVAQSAHDAVTPRSRGRTTHTQVMEVNLIMDDGEFVVEGLDSEIEVNIPIDASSVPEGTHLKCKYWNRQTSQWSTNDVRTVAVDWERKVLRCATRHLSTFAGTLPDEEDETVSPLAIAGIVVGGLALVALFVGAVVFRSKLGLAPKPRRDRLDDCECAANDAIEEKLLDVPSEQVEGHYTALMTNATADPHRRNPLHRGDDTLEI